MAVATAASHQARAHTSIQFPRLYSASLQLFRCTANRHTSNEDRVIENGEGTKNASRLKSLKMPFYYIIRQKSCSLDCVSTVSSYQRIKYPTIYLLFTPFFECFYPGCSFHLPAQRFMVRLLHHNKYEYTSLSLSIYSDLHYNRYIRIRIQIYISAGNIYHLVEWIIETPAMGIHGE